MKLVLCSLDEKLSEAWKKVGFDQVDGVETYGGDILRAGCQAVVSPANSFGFMDGGLDAYYLNEIGFDLQRRVRQAIYQDHGGELVVGNGLVVETGVTAPSHLVVAPTMRVPMRLPRDTVNPYLAMRAALRVAQSSGINSLAVPGLGTGVGGLQYDIVAHQMRAAFRDIIEGPHPMPESWSEASARHQELYGQEPRDLQRD